MNVLSFKECLEVCKRGEGFQILCSNRDEEDTLLETLFSLDDYSDRKGILKRVRKREDNIEGDCPRQVFFNTVFTEYRGKKLYEFYGVTFEEGFDGLLMPDVYRPFSFDEVMEYYCGGSFNFTELVGDTSNDVFSLL